MPKINARASVTGFATAPAVPPNPVRPAQLKKENTTYPHDESDHWVYNDGTLICLCVCLRCWPLDGGNCPEHRGPVS